MPAPWKKQKGNRISRLVSDIQSSPKRGGSLVVETGFPTSIVDLFVKNKDRLKKPPKKKQSLKPSNAIIEETVTDQNNMPMVSDPFVSESKLEVPSSPNDEKSQEILAQNEIFDSHGEKFVTQKDSCVILSNDCCNDENEEEEGGNNGGVLNYKKVICLLVLKGSLVGVVALYTKRFILGITLGALLLLLLEYFGDSFVQYVGHCEGTIKRVKCYFFGCGESRENVENGLVFDKANEEGGNSLVFKWEMRNETPSRRIIDQEQDGDGIGSKGEIEQENVQTFLIKDSKRIDDEMWDQIVNTIEALDPNVGPQRNSCFAPGGLCELQGINWPIPCEEEEDNGETKVVNQNGNNKTKKGKKFWKKFALKHTKKNKQKQNKDEQQEGDNTCDVPKDCNEEFAADLVNDDEDGGDEPGNFDSLFEQNSTLRNNKSTSDNYTLITYDMLRLDGANSNLLIMMVVALAGLIQGRVFALMLTVICCFMFNMMRS